MYKVITINDIENIKYFIKDTIKELKILEKKIEVVAEKLDKQNYNQSDWKELVIK